MLTLIFILLVIFIYIAIKEEIEIVYCPLIVTEIFLIFGIMFNIACLVEGRTLEAKIDMYTQENIEIEQSIDALVKDYYKHEQETYNNLTPENAILFASAYPELKSNELAISQLNIYFNNNIKIKNLKEDQINLSKNKFWLYFGT